MKHLLFVLIFSSIVITNALAKEFFTVKSGECFSDEAKKNKHYAQSSSMKIPFIYLSGYKKNLSDMKKDFNLSDEQLKDVEVLKEVMGKRIGEDLCLSINQTEGDLEVKCTGTILDGEINNNTKRFYAKKFSCVKTIKCNMDTKEIEAYKESVYKENVDLVIPKRCLK